jgi:hypothetical protein
MEAASFAFALFAFASCEKNELIDEAKAAGLTTAEFRQITADIFKPMDGRIDLSPEEIMGHNTWNARHDGDHACAVTASFQVWNTT